MSVADQTIALVGNPNCGKTTVFNALTGRNQRVGNWPGVTVERKEGNVDVAGGHLRVVDLPGIYALLASSEDERVARDYIVGGEPGLVVDIVDATNLERNLFLTTQLLDMEIPLVVVLNMTDLAEAQGIVIDVDALSGELGCPVVGITATRKRDVRKALVVIERAWTSRPEMRPSGERKAPNPLVAQPPAVESVARNWEEDLARVAAGLGTNGRWLALKIIERDRWATARAIESGAIDRERIDHDLQALETELGESADVVLAEARYRFIERVVSESQTRRPPSETRSDKVDRIVLHRLFGIPIFLFVMYLLFWFTITVGGAFIDFFDLAGGTILVGGFGHLLESIGSPQWLVTILANGIGAGLQTVITFIPVIFAMFLGLSILEDSGYMARAAFVMDRFMRWIGLPGKSFVPMLIGFGCNVPAIMATRTLENKRDRYLTIFMNPFMSCGARLPVYALFAVAFFGAAAGVMTFSLYLVGIVVAILTGLLLKRTLFRGAPSYFVMELPPYHTPRAGSILRYSWRRLLHFMTRAKYIVPIVAVLAVLNSVGTDGSFGQQEPSKSVLSAIGRTVTPIFSPMGVKQENWPATVGLFTGILAKETVVGTLNSLYSQTDAAASHAEVDSFSFFGGLKDAAATIPANLRAVPAGLADPLGLGIVGGSSAQVAEQIGAEGSVYAGLRAGFTEGRPQAYAYLLFVLLYLPCVAAFGAMTREMGLRYTLVAVSYLGLTSWSVATLFYQLSVGRSPLWIAAGVVALSLLPALFWIRGRMARPMRLRAGRLAVTGEFAADEA
jgi:ferrous iron transport protein B